MENKTIEALEKLIQIKDETIKELEKQIQLLKNQPTQQPITIPTFPQPPQYPWYPTSPIIGPTTTPFINPLAPPYIITSDGTSSTMPDFKITSDSVLPPGSIQMNVPNNVTSGYIQVSNESASNLNIVPSTNTNVTYIQKTGC